MKINSKEKEKRNLENYNTTRMFHGELLRDFVTEAFLGSHLDTKRPSVTYETTLRRRQRFMFEIIFV
jgi:hypothetical protein